MLDTAMFAFFLWAAFAGILAVVIVGVIFTRTKA
jgi:hypothetical protein